MIGALLHRAALALDAAREVAPWALDGARLALAARLDPEAHRRAYGPHQPPRCPACGGPGCVSEWGSPDVCASCCEAHFEACHAATLDEARRAIADMEELRRLARAFLDLREGYLSGETGTAEAYYQAADALRAAVSEEAP